MPELRRSPLESCHLELGAKMVAFGGWQMPLSYPSGTLAEHMACRGACAVFDVSHLGTVHVRGREGLERLQRSLCNDLEKIGPGQAQYTQLLDEYDGSVLDDIIVWWRGDGDFEVMPNASNTASVLDAVGGRDVTGERALIAIQGPEARAVVGKVAPEVAAIQRFSVCGFRWSGAQCTAAGTGYTGEDGIECSISLDRAADFWQAIVDAGAVPAGLGARDTLRLEAGLPLHGHELGPGITPLQAGLGWVVAWDKPSFRGKVALQEERDRGVARVLVGIRSATRQPPRAGHFVSREGRKIGEVTSGNFSPVLERGIGMALVEAGCSPGVEVFVEAQGRSISCKTARLPFVRHGKPIS